MPPVAIAAGIGAVGAIGGAALSASAQKKAAGKAADTSLATAKMNNALQEKIYGQNQAILSPYVNRGNEAGSAINALLGISGTNPTAGPGAQAPPTQTNPQYGQPVAANDEPIQYNSLSGLVGQMLQRRFAQRRLSEGGQGAIEGMPQETVNVVPGTAPAAGAIPGQSAYENAFANYRNSTGYQFQMDQGTKAINQGYAANGSLQSGAALKALQTYGQNTATGFFKDYLGLLSNQQGVGLSGANAISGVGTNYANSVSANNNNAGNSAANAYLAQGNATAGMWGNIGGAIGSVANAWGSSYRP